MSFKGREKHFFLGGNTPEGFYSYYDYLISQENARRIYCIKGGPGTGKSTFMKKIADEVIKKGCDVEFAHCSSDPDSLDGIIIKPINIAFVDGTSPHIVDPKTPGAVDRILYLGECWREAEIACHKEGIMRTNKKISECFSTAYNYLCAAEKLKSNADNICKKSMQKNICDIYTESMIFREFAEMPVSEVRGEERKLFATAVTPKGLVNHIESLLDGYKTYVIKGYSDEYLNNICRVALGRGFDVESYYCPLSPNKKIDHLLIPKLNLGFTTSNDYHFFDKGEIIDFTEFSSKYIMETHKEEYSFSTKQAKALIDKAIETIKLAKSYHDELEKYYIPAMDFAKIDEIHEKTIKEVLEFI